MRLAARWIGEFHAANERRAVKASMRFLTAYDSAYYRGWPRRSRLLARRHSLTHSWLEPLCRRMEDEIVALADMRPTIIHGEFYPHNVMFQRGIVRPVDWETAAVAPGEIDLATLTEGWSRSECCEIEAEYKLGRWSGDAPASFLRNLDLARAYMQLRWLGDNDGREAGNMTRWRRLLEIGRRLELASGKADAT
jgi:thiamine kinase-like enzyme